MTASPIAGSATASAAASATHSAGGAASALPTANVDVGRAVRIHRLVDLEAAGHPTAPLVSGIDTIFRATAARWPVDTAAAAAFRHLWLGQYLDHERDLVFVAVPEPPMGAAPAQSPTQSSAGSPTGSPVQTPTESPARFPAQSAAVAGYLVACRIDPAQSPRFAALDYFQAFASMCARYPAHLHVNLDAAYRGHRIGERLVAAVRDHLRAEGLPGLHAVTSRGQRNVRFYERLGFRELAATPRGTSEVLFMGLRLQ